MSDKPVIMSALEKLAILEQEMSQDLHPALLETPDDELVKQAALSVSEEVDLREFISSGCQGIKDYDKSRMEALYLSGHDSDDLMKIFPYASRGGLAFLKTTLKWKEKREEFLNDLQFKSKLMLANSKMKTIFTISSLLNAFNKNLEGALLKYAATGDASVLPVEFVPKGIRDAKELISLMKMFGDLKLNDSPPVTPTTNVQVNVDNNSQQNKPKPIDALEYLMQPSEKKP